MTITFYPGSFDPVTIGHLRLIERATQHDIGDNGTLVVVVGDNPDKAGSYMFDKDVRAALLELSLPLDIRPFVKIEFGSKQNECSLLEHYKPSSILRGIRTIADADQELKLAARWRQTYEEILGPHFRVLWQDCPQDLQGVSSTALRQAIKENDRAAIHRLMPTAPAQLLMKVLSAYPHATTDRLALNHHMRAALAYAPVLPTPAHSGWAGRFFGKSHI